MNQKDLNFILPVLCMLGLATVLTDTKLRLNKHGKQIDLLRYQVREIHARRPVDHSWAETLLADLKNEPADAVAADGEE